MSSMNSFLNLYIVNSCTIFYNYIYDVAKFNCFGRFRVRIDAEDH